MKYIRTVDGIYGYDENEMIIKHLNPENYDVLVYKDMPYIIVNTKLDDKIIAQADTIEELCDWFFLEGAKGYPINYKKFHTAKRAKERMQIEQELYGVIHVKGKGLIYVAKMNDKGVLELI